ncbi:uncharacterized protein Z519_12192 [Cladophialophora bantiana CBS 173.52]|uniref:SDR family oxidoreductase n=1 Tax=Cladophialophora bantiana (strain ATCC 10958 / CBS 173.52 / CDC B-1940 / NIH 8579) TaxID=1442370 RepID=A0A0D2HSC7_CLAB1|nr:uncharacterized protein Z519_12192 [Cladophialophora bantiana CBS 173.52]KIW87289.1 hypothetical protein Z519_12192 [Cladophialophora bantiana CBS 173.52]
MVISGRRLEGKVAVVTGGGGGIGSAVGQTFSEKRAKVALVDRDPELLQEAIDEIKGHNPQTQVASFVVNPGEESEAARVVKETGKTFEGIDVLVNNVGIRSYIPIDGTPWDKWHDIINVNMRFVSMTRACWPTLRKSGRGSIVNISSMNGVYGGRGMGAYDSMKSAVLTFSRTLAHEEHEHNVRVNSFCPGFTRTKFQLKRLGQDTVDDYVPSCNIRRWADPVELVYPILWLASEEASYVTVGTFMIDGGYGHVE